MTISLDAISLGGRSIAEQRPPATLGDVWSASVEAMRLVDNTMARSAALERAYDQRIDQVFAATGQRLINPLRINTSEMLARLGSAQSVDEVEAIRGETTPAGFAARLRGLALERPEHAGVIAPDRELMRDAEALARAAEHRLHEAYGRAPEYARFWASLGGSLRASFEDPVNVGASLIGGGGPARTLLWSAIKMGGYNAAAEAGMQPFVQAWRDQAGLESGLLPAARNVGTAFLFGAGLDAGGRLAFRGFQSARGLEPRRDGQGAIVGWSRDGSASPSARASPAAASAWPGGDPLEAAARGSSDDVLRRAAAGDPAALAELGDRMKGHLDDDARGALEAVKWDLELEKPPVRVDDGEHLRRLSQALAHAGAPHMEPPPGAADAVRPLPKGPSLAEGQPAPLPGQSYTVDGKPVSFVDFAPDRLELDPATFQFKQAGSDRLEDVKTWDPVASGKIVVYEYTDGLRVVADGHGRLGLARRLIAAGEKNLTLQGFLFREADGWRPDQVRVQAAKKNIQEGSAVSTDVARILREAPEIVDRSLPVRSPVLKEARALAKLSDAGFAMVARGEIEPNRAAIVGDLVAEPERHAVLLGQIGEAGLATLRQVRLFIGEQSRGLRGARSAPEFVSMGLGHQKARVEVLDGALRELETDSKVFDILNSEAVRIRGTGNVLSVPENERRAAIALSLRQALDQAALEPGRISDWLSAAALSVQQGRPKRAVGTAFALRVRELIEREGLAGLKGEPEPPPARIDDPAGPDAKAQTQALAAARAARRPDDEEIPFDLPEKPRALAPEDIDAIVDNWRFIQTAARRPMPERLNAWIIRAGRVQDQGGEITRILGGKDRRLISGKGATLDDMALKAWEEGFLDTRERPTIDDLLAAIDRDHNDDFVVRRADAGYLEDVRAAREMEQDLDRLGVAGAKSEDEVRRILAETGDDTGDVGGGVQGAEGAGAGGPRAGESGGGAGQKPRGGKGGKGGGGRRASLLDGELRLDRTPEQSAALGDRIERLARRVLPPDVRVRFQDRIVFEGRVAAGRADPAEALIYVSLKSSDPLGVAAEEMAHILKGLGLFTDEQWSLLARHAERHGLREKLGIEAQYKPLYEASYKGDADRVDAALEDETVARMVAGEIAGEARPRGVLGSALDAVRGFLRSIRLMLGAKRTVADVFADIRSGGIAKQARAGEPGDPRAVLEVAEDEEIGHTFRMLATAYGRGDLLDVLDRYAGAGQDKAPLTGAAAEAASKDLGYALVRARERGLISQADQTRLWRWYQDARRRYETEQGFGDPDASVEARRDAGIAAAIAHADGARTIAGKLDDAAGRDVQRILEQAERERRISRDDRDSYWWRYKTFRAFYDKQLAPDAAAARARATLSEEMALEAEHRRRQALLTDAAGRGMAGNILTYRNQRGEHDPAKALIAVLEHFGLEGNPGIRSVDGQRKAIIGRAHARLNELIWEFRSGALAGDLRRRSGPVAARLDDVVREAFGQGSGDIKARHIATAWAEVAEELRQRFNAAGGAIGKLEKWGLPQMHDARAVRKAGFPQWREITRPLLDPSLMRHPLSGRQLTPAEVDASLQHVWESIALEGWNTRNPSGQNIGRGPVSAQHGDHRFLQFKDADAWLAYQRAFGEGDPFAAMMRYVNLMARDIAAMELMGPDPRATLTWMQQVVEQEAVRRQAGLPARFPTRSPGTGRPLGNARDYAALAIKRSDEMWSTMRGDASVPVSTFWADAVFSIRNLITSAFLGATSFTALSDLGTGAVARRFAGAASSSTALGETVNVLGAVVRQFASGNRREAIEAGLILESASHAFGQQARYVGQMNGPWITSYLSDRVLTLSGLSPLTQAGRHAHGLNFQAKAASWSNRTFQDLPAYFRDNFQRYGIGRAEWDIIRASAVHRPRRGIALLRPNEVEASGGRELAERYLEMMLQETERAVPSTTVRGRSIMLGEDQPGTLWGSLKRSAAQFKSFPATIVIVHLNQIFTDLTGGNLARAAQYGGGLLITGTLLGALSLQLGSLSLGKDPRPMDDPKFWFAAMLKSGGLGIYGDFFFGSTNQHGRSLGSTVAGPTVGFIGDTLNLTVGNALELAEGKKTRFGREAVRYAARYTPGSSLWYTRLAWERTVLDQIQWLTDKDAARSFAARASRTRRDYGQEFWWRPGEASPRRAPGF